MKLIIAILHQEDEPLAVEDLNKKGFFVTKLATTGGFFKNHNVTLLIGTQDHLVSDAITILHKDAGKRHEPRYYPQPSASGPTVLRRHLPFPWKRKQETAPFLFLI